MISVLEKEPKWVFASTCQRVKEMELDKRPFRIIIFRNQYSLEMDITDAELRKLKEEVLCS